MNEYPTDSNSSELYFMHVLRLLVKYMHEI